MPSSRSLQTMLNAPSSTVTPYQPMYNPQSGQQYQPGTTFTGAQGGLAFILGLNKDLQVGGTALKEGWAPQIGHITTKAESVGRRRTNPLLAPAATAKKRNPFVIEQVPSADLFGLNLAT